MDVVNDSSSRWPGGVGPVPPDPASPRNGPASDHPAPGSAVPQVGARPETGLITRNDPGAAEGDISQYQALTTALAATVGVGNIAGVATAIYLGGPGALFWMWVTGLVGMASKYSEAFLGVKYRKTDAKGEMSGGPQYYLARAIPNRFGLVLSLVFAVFAVLASFGIGNMTQANTVATQMDGTFGVPTWVSGAVMTVLAAAVLLGGIKSIGRVTAGFVPAMIILYVGAGILVLAVNVGEIPAALGLVFSDAFTGTAATGGFIGSVFMLRCATASRAASSPTSRAWVVPRSQPRQPGRRIRCGRAWCR